MLKRIVILFTNYGPYHLSRLEAFYEYCESRSWEVVGIELTRSGVDYQWKTTLDRIPISIISLTKEDEFYTIRFDELVQKLYRSLSELSPDVVAISGYARPTMLAALVWTILHQKISILFSETQEKDTQRQFGLEKLKSFIVTKYNAALVGGKSHKSYLKKLGLSPENIFLGYDTVKNSVFDPIKNRQLPRPIPQNYFLSISRFIPKKNLLFLIDCYAEYRRKSNNDRAWNLVICGDGKLKDEIEQSIKRLNLEKFVRLPGFLQQSELLPYLAHANCFIHASTTEQWGLVVNEAMASGLPVLISNRCGCFEDLVIEEINGFGFDPEDRQQLISLMLRMSSEEVDLQKMGCAALKHIQNFSPDYFARGLAKAIESVAGDKLT
ncbi:glycosyltransferase family 4 protein [Oscillatoriales cyanobacterium LEGE 11467]|uniref:Glycosyltransferase family 4 protein n=1 Tax=Zarconia navalis LEGE 11467 TaxID=1828826 RepID=A0A928Z9E7_9CYAN|nr:glycosyltransferase family 4 protein [Zarconia navalis]MBE9041619.1 glycosyltransferase family 4 protein [Zarconia navalis LEGE 11467]